MGRGYLQMEHVVAAVFYEVGDEARGKADEEGATLGLLGVGAKEVGAQNVLLQQSRAGVPGQQGMVIRPPLNITTLHNSVMPPLCVHLKCVFLR